MGKGGGTRLPERFSGFVLRELFAEVDLRIPFGDKRNNGAAHDLSDGVYVERILCYREREEVYENNCGKIRLKINNITKKQ